ncbi:hypothetical protein NIA13_17670, partial [Oscillibacter valericigenes]|nr:hypothetical protein [Oscillibacter valericigenes]
KHIHFLGYELKMIPGNSRTGYITKTIPDKERLQRKVDSIAEEMNWIGGFPVNGKLYPHTINMRLPLRQTEQRVEERLIAHCKARS